MESTEQNLELVIVDTLSDHLLSAVSSRLARQQGIDVDTEVVVRWKIECQGEESAVAISSLMQLCQRVDLQGTLLVPKDIGKQGWAAMREALSWRLHDIPHLDTPRKSFMASARREDLRAIWESLSLSWRFKGDHEVFDKQEEGWRALEQFLDLTNEEWRAAKRSMGLQQILFFGGQQLNLPPEVNLDNVGPMMVPFFGEMMEVEMQQPGGEGLLMAIHQALGPLPPHLQPQVGEVQDQVGEGQDQVGKGQGNEEDEEGDGNH